uniref:Uncharacterized protein n=1 Tax=Palpitomonas bilix TaxID=652834 RepID=A0A7S3G520_9EUKA
MGDDSSGRSEEGEEFEPRIFTPNRSALFLAVTSSGCAACCLVMALSRSLPLAYFLYALDQLFMTAAITTASFSLARQVGDEAVGAVLALNVLVTTALQSLVQLIIGKHVAHLSVFSQFFCFGALYACCVFASITMLCVSFCIRHRGSKIDKMARAQHWTSSLTKGINGE